jgi:hypothetical protein
VLRWRPEVEVLGTDCRFSRCIDGPQRRDRQVVCILPSSRYIAADREIEDNTRDHNRPRAKSREVNNTDLAKANFLSPDRPEAVAGPLIAHPRVR